VAEAAVFEAVGEGRYRVAGELTFRTVTALLAQSQVMFQAPAPALDLDLGEVARADSAGLALLIEWLRGARTTGKAIRFHRVSPQMRAILQVSDLDSILPLD
jgi:phospholipid transport system transporter-binding protein